MFDVAEYSSELSEFEDPPFDVQTIRALFDDLAPVYWMNELFSLGLTNRWRRHCVRAAAIRPGDSVCDLLSGTGECWTAIRNCIGHSGKLTALDCSPAMVAMAARKRGPAATQLCEDIRRATIVGGSIDAAVCCFGWKLFSRDRIAPIVEAVDRILKPGGRFAAVEVTPFQSRLPRFAIRSYLEFIVPGIASLWRGGVRHRQLIEYLEAFDGFEETARLFRLKGYPVTERSLSGGLASLMVVEKPTV